VDMYRELKSRHPACVATAVRFRDGYIATNKWSKCKQNGAHKKVGGNAD